MKNVYLFGFLLTVLGVAIWALAMDLGTELDEQIALREESILREVPGSAQSGKHEEEKNSPTKGASLPPQMVSSLVKAEPVRPEQIRPSRGRTLVAEEMVKPEARVIVGLDEADLSERITKMESTNEYSPIDVATYFEYLRGNLGSKDTSIRENSVRDQVFESIIAHRPKLEGIADLLLEIAENPNQHITMRNYSVQHMANYIDNRKNFVEGQTEDLKQMAGDFSRTLYGLVENEPELASTALLSLDFISKAIEGSVDQGELTRKIKEVAISKKYDAPNRGTALQLLHKNGDESARQLAKEMVYSQEFPVQFSAIGALGSSGKKDDLKFLKELKEKSETDSAVKLASASLYALNKAIVALEN